MWGIFFVRGMVVTVIRFVDDMGRNVAGDLVAYCTCCRPVDAFSQTFDIAKSTYEGGQAIIIACVQGLHCHSSSGFHP